MIFGMCYNVLNYSVFCQKWNKGKSSGYPKGKVLKSETTWDPLTFVLVINFLFMGKKKKVFKCTQ